MTIEQIQELMPSGIACGMVRSYKPDKHWNVKFWTQENSNFFTLILTSKPGESLEDIINRGLPVVKAVVLALNLT